MQFIDEWPAYAPSEILPGLFQGGTEDDEVLGYPAPSDHYRTDCPFDLIVTLYADAMPAPWGVQEMRYGFPDGRLEAKSIDTVLGLAHAAYASWTFGEQVLIRCQAGVNRSGLVTALVLMMAGMTADQAIALIRAKRSPLALSNAHFERWLREEAEIRLNPSSRRTDAA